MKDQDEQRKTKKMWRSEDTLLEENEGLGSLISILMEPERRSATIKQVQDAMKKGQRKEILKFKITIIKSKHSMSIGR